MNAARQLDVVRALYDATGRGNWARAESLLTEDFFVTEASTLPFAGVYRGRGALKELFTRVMSMLNVTALDIQAHTAGDDHVVVLLQMVLAGDPPVRVPVAEMFRFREDKVCEIRPYYFDPTPLNAAVRAR